MDFVHLWVYLSATPLFGLNATRVVYVLALGLQVVTASLLIPLVARWL